MTMATHMLENLSRSEKLRLMEALWSDLSADAPAFASPAWHAQALDVAAQAHAAGAATFVDWQHAKKVLRER